MHLQAPNVLLKTLWCWILLSSVGLPETLEVDFRRVISDPLIDYTPASFPGDKSVVTRDGLRVQQVPDQASAKTAPREIGAKMLISGSGDFTAELDWEVKKLESPKEGWGQGVIFTIELDDPEITELQMGIIAKPGKEAQVRAAKKGRKVKEPILKTFPDGFKSGVFVIERKNKEAIFSIRQNGVSQELARFECPKSDLRYASVWCTRLPKGNTAGDYLFRSMKVSADSFFSYQTSRETTWGWWKIALIVQVIVIAILIAVKVFRK